MQRRQEIEPRRRRGKRAHADQQPQTADGNGY
jgi:hypothetical protein